MRSILSDIEFSSIDLFAVLCKDYAGALARNALEVKEARCNLWVWADTESHPPSVHVSHFAGSLPWVSPSHCAGLSCPHTPMSGWAGSPQAAGGYWYPGLYGGGPGDKSSLPPGGVGWGGVSGAEKWEEGAV